MGRFQQNQVQQGEIRGLSLGVDILTADTQKGAGAASSSFGSSVGISSITRLPWNPGAPETVLRQVQCLEGGSRGPALLCAVVPGLGPSERLVNTGCAQRHEVRHEGIYTRDT